MIRLEIASVEPDEYGQHHVEFTDGRIAVRAFGGTLQGLIYNMYRLDFRSYGYPVDRAADLAEGMLELFHSNLLERRIA